ncbi:MAG TPA: hypothetical protein VE130_07085 [Nitrososphaeraceae archaeon]|nr:hypothetical protein [Nitrososphaeraceae archaeon]
MKVHTDGKTTKELETRKTRESDQLDLYQRTHKCGYNPQNNSHGKFRRRVQKKKHRHFPIIRSLFIGSMIT